MSPFSLLAMVAAIAIEALYLSIGRFRLVPWETYPLVAAAFVTAWLGWRAKRGKLRATWAVIASLLALLYVWADRIAPRLPERTPAPESVVLVVEDLAGAQVRVPGDLKGNYALLTVFRGAW